MRKIFTSFALIAGISFTALCGGAKDETLATFDGGTVTTSEVAKNTEQEFYEIEMKAFQAKQQGAFEAAKNKIFEIESKKRNTTVEKMLEEELGKRKSVINDESVRQFYEANKARINQPFAAVKESLKSRMIANQDQSAKQSFTSELFTKYNFKFNLKEPKQPTIVLANDGKPFWGNKDAKVVITEFSDFECPYCRDMQGDVQRIKVEYANRIKWVFRNFPLDFHSQAMPTHIAASCVGKQNKYFEFQTRVFGIPTQGRGVDMSPPQLERIAQSIGIDMNAYRKCAADASGKERAEIEADMQYGQKVGVRGTPTIFINGVLFQKQRNYQSLKEEIDRLLN